VAFYFIYVLCVKRLDGGKRLENVGKGEKRLIMECKEPTRRRGIIL